MSWGALSEARLVQPQETVIRGHGGDYCVCRCNTSKYTINSFNTGWYRRYTQYSHIHTIQTHTCNGQPAQNNFLDLVARTLSNFSLPRNLTCTFGAKYILKNTYTYRQYKHIHTHTNSIVCDMYLATSYNKIHTIHTNTDHIHTRKTGLKKNGFLIFLSVFACICLY